MGYLTRLSGGLTIVPPLTLVEFQDSPFVEFSGGGSYDIRLQVEVVRSETPQGILETGTCARVVTCEDRVTAYDLEDELQRLVDSLSGHEFTGHINGDGEEAGDQWRLYVRDGRVVKVTPKIVWPEVP